MKKVLEFKMLSLPAEEIRLSVSQVFHFIFENKNVALD